MAVPSFSPGDIATAAVANTWFLPAAAFKTGDTSRTSTTAVASDPDLAISLLAGATYEISLNLGQQASSGGTSPGLKCSFSVPGTPTAWSGITWIHTSLVPTFEELGTPWSGTLFSDADLPILAAGIIQVPSNGSLAFQWAQNSSSPTATIVRAGGYLIARRIG